MGERPDGSTATSIGWALVVIGVLAAFFVGTTESATSFWLSIAVSNLGIGLGVLLLSLGYLVRAIWFLPGRPIAPTRKEKVGGGESDCEWCGNTVQAPAIPCSAFPAEQLPIEATRIKSATCRNELDARGHLL